MADAASSVLVASLEATALTQAELNFFRKEAPAGVTLFRRNIPNPYSETLKLTQSLQSLRSPGELPMLVCIDQEGGRVSRIGAPFPNLGPALKIAGGSRDRDALDLISQYGEQVGVELVKLGINVNFAPVCDVITEPTNEAIGDRAFGEDADSAQARATAFIDGANMSGVLSAVKHFPGQGAAKADTHKSDTAINLPLELLMERDVKAFIEPMIRSHMVMMSHCRYPSLDGVQASLSKVIIGKLLRGKLGYEGVIVSDDMVMEAIPQETKEWQEKIVAAVAAGVDMILVCKHLDRSVLAIEALRAEAKRHKSFNNRLVDAAERVNSLRRRIPS